MSREGNGAARREGPPRDVQQPARVTEQNQSLTVAPGVALRVRRAAALRLPPLPDGRRDPLDGLAGEAAKVRYGSTDGATLGLGCAHGDDCPARRGAAA